MKVNKPKLYARETGVDRQKKKLSHEQYAANLHKCLVKAFVKKSKEWNVPLDKVITYGQIKEWISSTLGYSHWHQLPQHAKAFVLSSKNGSYPEWEDTEVKPLSKN